MRQDSAEGAKANAVARAARSPPTVAVAKIPRSPNPTPLPHQSPLSISRFHLLRLISVHPYQSSFGKRQIDCKRPQALRVRRPPSVGAVQASLPGSGAMHCLTCLLGCFRRSKSNTVRLESSATGQGLLEKSISSGNDSDFLADEGSNYQQDLWQMVVQQKLLQIQRQSALFNVEDNTDSTPEAFLQTLTALYNSNGFAPRVPRLREIFLGIEPFTAAIHTMTKSNPIAALVWGSLTLIFQVSPEDT